MFISCPFYDTKSSFMQAYITTKYVFLKLINICQIQVSTPLPGEPKSFSNRWKTRKRFFQSLENLEKFSNHWKNIFQSLENLIPSAKLPDCPKPKRVLPCHGLAWRRGEGRGIVRGMTLKLHWSTPHTACPVSS
jgi:hypothetical protein